MKLALVTDAWQPQVNGVVTTLIELVSGLRSRGHEVQTIEPSTFRRFKCPGYPEVELAWLPRRQVARRLDALQPDAVHIATEGPLGGAARSHCLARGWAFTTAFHTRFPSILASALHIPESWGYAWFRRFHAPSSGVMVPTEGMLRILRGYGFDRLRAWSHGVDLSLFHPVLGADLGLPRPVWLCIGRVSYEKNLEAFLRLELPGTKVVYGTGPLRAALEHRYPEVVWRGVVPRNELAGLYSAADAFVMPSRSETFGLVLLEAMACGTPVAAFPEAGPLDVLGLQGPGASEGGVLDPDLAAAALKAATLDRARVRERALQFDWQAVCDQFIGHLVPTQPGAREAVTAGPQKVHKLSV
jgi:glycosyltransferase involved in cell wall biosynthesis